MPCHLSTSRCTLLRHPLPPASRSFYGMWFAKHSGHKGLFNADPELAVLRLQFPWLFRFEVRVVLKEFVRTYFPAEFVSSVETLATELSLCASRVRTKCCSEFWGLYRERPDPTSRHNQRKWQGATRKGARQPVDCARGGLRRQQSVRYGSKRKRANSEAAFGVLRVRLRAPDSVRRAFGPRRGKTVWSLIRKSSRNIERVFCRRRQTWIRRLLSLRPCRPQTWARSMPRFPPTQDQEPHMCSMRGLL